MATTTPNFGWDVPQSTDLVKDGATAIAALGNDIDTSLVDLKGGTTGQVLSKASNTDMDFTWSSVDPLTILDAKGDLITATAADTPARLAVGTNGQALLADSSTATGLKWGDVSSSLALAAVASGSTTSGTTLTISSLTQDYLVLYLKGFNFGTAGQITLTLNGSTSSIYNYVGLQIRTGGNTTRVATQTGTGFSLSSNGNNADAGSIQNDGVIIFSNAKASGFTSVEWIFSYRDASSNDNFNFGSGWFESAAQMTSFTITFPGTLSAGTYELIGA